MSRERQQTVNHYALTRYIKKNYIVRMGNVAKGVAYLEGCVNNSFYGTRLVEPTVKTQGR